MKIETSTGWFGEAAAEAWAMPVVEMPGESAEAPYTREREPGRAQQEVAAAEPGAGRQRHPRLDRGQPAAGLGDAAAEHLRRG